MSTYSLTPISLYSAPLGSLDHLGFNAFLPHAQLQTWVQCYWTAQTTFSNMEINENLYPDGGTGLIIDFKPNQLPHIRINATQTLTQMLFYGDVDRMGVRFQPGGIYQLLDIEIPEIIGGDFSLEELGIKVIAELQQELGGITTVGQRIDILSSWLLRQAKRRGAKSGLIQHLVPHLQSSDNSFDDLSHKLTISRRQLERKFREEVGLSPHQFKQLHRVRHARRMIMLNPEASLTGIAQEAGFYDQAHFIRNFQKITGQTPGQYRMRKMSQKYNPG